MGSELVSVAVFRGSAIETLRLAGVATPARDVDLLLQHVLQVNQAGLVTAQLTTNQRHELELLIERRASREPLQHIIGLAYFRYLELSVGPGVFVPRPETEVLVDLALVNLPNSVAVIPQTPLGEIPVVVVDLCAGSGVIALSLATESAGLDQLIRRQIQVYAVELDDAAIGWTRRNADKLQSQLLANVAVAVVQADARSAAIAELARLRGQVALVTCNPPYIPSAAIPRDPEVRDFDPAVALFGGPDGLDVVRDILDTAADLLYPGGVLLIEHGDQQGDEAGELGVPQLVRSHGAFSEVQDHLDLTGRPRVTVAVRN